MFLFRSMLFAAGAFLGGKCLLMLWLECGFRISTVQPHVLAWSALGACVVGVAYYVQIGMGYRTDPDLNPSVDSVAVASGAWFPFALQACLAALL